MTKFESENPEVITNEESREEEPTPELFDSLSPEDIVDILFEFWERMPELADMIPENSSDIQIKMIIREELMRAPLDNKDDKPSVASIPSEIESGIQWLFTLAALAGIFEEEIIEKIIQKNQNIESIKNPEKKEIRNNEFIDRNCRITQRWKSTLFNALVKTRQAEASNYAFCTIDPNIGIVDVPDQRLQKLYNIVVSSMGQVTSNKVNPKSKIRNPKQIPNSNVPNSKSINNATMQQFNNSALPKIIPATVEFIDIAGIVKSA